MKKNILLVIALFTLFSVSAVAAIPTTLNLQGHINTAAGEPINTTEATFEFKLFDVATGSTPI